MREYGAVITFRNGKPGKMVKNLGWLIRHRNEVNCFRVTERSDDGDCWLDAYMKDGSVYITQFASRDVLWTFLHRPVWCGRLIDWFGDTVEIKNGCGFRWEPRT